LLGGFRVAVGPRAVEKGAWRLRKAASLVKLLTLAPGNRLHREQVMETLWPDLGKKTASNNLRQALQGARRALNPDPASGPRLLASSEDALVLCPEGSVWVDAEAFEEAAKGARRSKEPAAYEAALDLYAGELLPEDRYEAWAEGPRARLRGTYLSLLTELASLSEERGDLGSAADLLGRLLAEEPTREGAHASLMRLYTLWGRRGEALSQYERLKDALARNLGAEPSASVRSLREEIAAGRYPPQEAPRNNALDGTVSAPRHNLPAPRDSFVGRERELAEVKRELASTRLLTLTGAGGAGKTRLALEASRDLAGVYPDGAWIAEFAPLSQGELVAQEVASALGVREQLGRSIEEALVEDLSSKRVLLLLDNCEHLLDACARLVDLLLGSCPRIRVIATSRERLGVAGEVVWRVPPLAVPEDAPATEELPEYGAVRLFLERARLRLPAFRLTPQNARAVAQTCLRLEGIPLAIELAAARMGTLATEQLAERLRDSLGLLSAGPRTAPPRQRTMRAAIGWSYGLLSEEEKEMFGRLSVFAGGFTLEAAEAVCPGGFIEVGEVLDLLSDLVDKSLVAAETSRDGQVRYRMLEPIRQYAQEKLQESGEVSEVQGRHVAFFFAVAEEGEPELAGPEQRLWVERLEGEHDNLREAFSWVLERGEAELGLRFGAALWRFWYNRGSLSEGIRWMERVLAGSDPAPAPARVKALEGLGWLAQLQGDAERAQAAYGEMLRLSRELGENGNIATALNSLGTLAAARGDNERARALLEENLSVLQELEDERNTATILKRFHMLGLLGFLALNEEGDYARGATLLEESLELAREVEDSFLVGTMLSNLGYAALLQGHNERAGALCEEALALAHELGSAGVEIVPEASVNAGLAALAQSDHERAAASFKDALAVSQEAGRKPSVINALEGMAGLAGALGEATRAARLWGGAEAARQATAIALPPGERALHEPYLASARSQLGEAVWEEALTEGRTMSLEVVVEYALSKVESKEETDSLAPPEPAKPPAGKSTGKLTPRELELAVLVAQGLTNRQVSTELGISERTAANHVANILRKLRLRSRAQIAGWAAERQVFTPDSD